MKIKVTIEVVECKSNDNYREAQRLLLLATKGIIERHVGRMKGLGSNIFGSFIGGAQCYSVIELEDEEEKKVEG